MTNNHTQYSLFLDDLRKVEDVTWVDLPLAEWVVVRTYDHFVAYVKLHGLPARVSFDHDLSPEHYTFDWAGNNNCSGQPTGYDCVKWLVQYCIDHDKEFPEYYLHTLNASGLLNMLSYIESFKQSTKKT